MKETNKPNKPFIRDILIYTITSIRELLLKGRISLFLKDIASFFRWRIFRVNSKSTIDYQIPWMSFAAIDFLKKWLKKEMLVFEYGSGGSSFFIAERVKQLYSVDHDEEWHKKVNELINLKNINNVEYFFYKPEAIVSPTEDTCGNPDNYLSCMGEFKDLNFETYVKSIDKFPDDYFDLIIVDGRARPSCIKHAMNKVKTGGVLLLDNADRTYYLMPFPALDEQDKWKLVSFIGHFPYGPASVLDTTKLFIKVS